MGSSTGAAVAGQTPVPAPLVSPQDLLFASPTTLDHVGRVVAAVMVDGKGPFRFIVDTGANRSTISPRLAAALGLTPSSAQSIRVAGITGIAEMASVPIKALQAGDLIIADARFPVVSAPMTAGTDGILGAAGLAQEKLLVDFRHDRVVITRSGDDAVPMGFTRLWATRLKGGLLSVPGRVGSISVNAVIDTGSGRTLGNLALYHALYGDRARGDALATRVFGATQQVSTGTLQPTPPLDLGAIKVGGAQIVFGDFPIFRVWGLTRRPTVVLGMDVLGSVGAFAIDFRHAEIAVDTQYD